MLLHDNLYLFFVSQLVEIAEGSLMEPENVTSFSPSECPQPNMKFEGYYNRDSIKYRDIYSIPEAKTIIRGTYRYKVGAWHM